MEKIVIQLRTKVAVLIVRPFDGEIDVEDLIKIDYSNLYGEVLTFPVAFNRIANLKADAANLVAHSKSDLDIFEATLYEEHRKKMAATEKRPTREDIKSAVLVDPRWKLKLHGHIENQKYFDYCDALYWSAQSKDTKLNKLIDRLSLIHI
jgi:hypothetical protein